MKKRYIFVGLIVLFLFIVVSNGDKVDIPFVVDEISSEFSNEQKVEIIGYDGDAMEPYISRDEKYLFFNNHKGDNDKDNFYATKVDDLTFEFKGEVQGVNTVDVDANPTMDSNNNFYFITTRDLSSGDFNTIYTDVFEDGIVTNLKKVNGTINVDKKMWINMGVEITKDGNRMYTSNAKFRLFANFPTKGDIRFAIREGDEFNIPENEEEIFKNINTNYSIEYAGEVSDDELEIFYSQVTLSNPPLFKMYHSKRNNSNEPFGIPQFISEPFVGNKNAFVEAPTLSIDGNRLYYHKLEEDGKFSIFMLTRN